MVSMVTSRPLVRAQVCQLFSFFSSVLLAKSAKLALLTTITQLPEGTPEGSKIFSFHLFLPLSLLNMAVLKSAYTGKERGHVSIARKVIRAAQLKKQ